MDDQRVKELCEASGVRVSEVRRADDVLVVVPGSLEGLPGPETLAQLAEQLREATSFRYVTLAVDESIPVVKV